jgi:hypothetical protein
VRLTGKCREIRDLLLLSVAREKSEVGEQDRPVQGSTDSLDALQRAFEPVRCPDPTVDSRLVGPRGVVQIRVKETFQLGIVENVTCECGELHLEESLQSSGLHFQEACLQTAPVVLWQVWW